MSQSKTPTERFWTKVNQNGPVPLHAPHLGQCWEWTAGLDRDGYGRFSLNGQTVGAHRVAFEWANGPITAETIDHRCRNRACVRPDHMRESSHAHNRVRARRSYCHRNHRYPQEMLWRPIGAPVRCKECEALRREFRRNAGNLLNQIMDDLFADPGALEDFVTSAYKP